MNNKDAHYKREEYILKCKYYADGVCMKKSGTEGIWHITILCTGDCQRMRNYDRKKGGQG